MDRDQNNRNLITPVVVLSGGVGGARLARGLHEVLGPALTVVVNVGDDDRIYGVDVSPDIDTVVYTLAGREGPQGWGLAGDTFVVMEHLAALGVDTTFRLGDADLATCIRRTEILRSGGTLSGATAETVRALGVSAAVLPVSDAPIRTVVETAPGVWRSFQEYFVLRGHRDPVTGLRYDGAAEAKPAPGVVEAIEKAGLVVIAPSNPPLSIWPMLAVPGLAAAVEAADRVVAVSPLFGGKALKGPAAEVMHAMGLPPGNAGVAAAYEGLIDALVIDRDDAADAPLLDVDVHVLDTRIAATADARRFATELLDLET